MTATGEKTKYQLEDIEEICVTLMAYEGKFLFQALGLASQSNSIGSLMGAAETMVHLKREPVSTINNQRMEEGKKTLEQVKTAMKPYKRSSGSMRNEIRFNFQNVQDACWIKGFHTITTPLLVMVLLMRNL